MNRRLFMIYATILGLITVPLPKKQAKACQKKRKELGKVTVKRIALIMEKIVEDEKGNIAEESYVPYEEYLQWRKDRREPWEKQLWKTEKDWLNKQVFACERNKEFHVFENNVLIGRLVFHLDSATIQFMSYVLDELITLKNWCDDNMDFDESLADPQKTAVHCVKVFREKAHKVLAEIVKYYNDGAN